MKIDQTIEELATAGVFLAVQDEKLICKARKGALTPERRHFIAEHKAEFIAFLQINTHQALQQEPPLMADGAKGPAPLSPTQRRLWFIDQLSDGVATYTLPVTYRLHGALDVTALQKALMRIIERHESLRTVIQLQADEPVAVVREKGVDVPVPESLEGLSAEEQDSQISECLQASLRERFDLTQESPLRVRLYRLASDRHVIMLTLSHIAADGWSIENLLHELSSLYTAFAAGDADPLPPLAFQYADYTRWQNQWLQGERLQRELDYWRTQLCEVPVVHGLPLDRPRPAHTNQTGGSWRQHLPEPLHQGLLELGQRYGSTLFMTLQAAFAVLLSRWSGENDIVMGTPVANRPRQELAPLIGFFANTLALRTRLNHDQSFVDVLRQARTVALDAYQHQHLPFELLVEDINPPRSVGHAPLVQIMFSLQDVDEDAAFKLPGISAEAIIPEASVAKFDLELAVIPKPDGLDVCWDFSSELFDVDTIADMGASLEMLLQGILAKPTQPVEQLPLLNARMQREIAALSHQAVTPCFDQCCLHTLIERQVERSPNAIAVTFEKETLTYAQLNHQANQLAHYLCRLGVGPDVLVAVAAERGLAMVIGLLAILKAGGAYVPLDPAYPADRLTEILEDSAPAVLLAQSSVFDQLPSVGIPTLFLDDTTPWEHEPSHNLHVADLNATHLAYVIYTSGSTGHPKGVMNEHGGVVNRLLWAQSQFQLSAADRILQKAPFGFDVSVWELFLPLLSGAQLVMAKPGCHRDPCKLAEVIESAGITMLHFVPSMLQAFMDGASTQRCKNVKHVLCSGEALSYSLQVRFHKVLPNVALHNLYGPTEAAIDVTHWRCDALLHLGVVPIGRPIANTRMYVLDSQRAAVPRGVAGELFIGGIQVARGYLNRPELTVEQFLADPFANNPDARMYKTGDLGRWLPDGSIEYLGRNDRQVKIRGLRIELGEIEQALETCEGVSEAVVIAREDLPDDKRLVAYLVMHEEHIFAPGDLRHALTQSLPEYMVPNAFLQLEHFPLTPNGKLNCDALPAPDEQAVVTRQYEAARGDVEMMLAKLWQDLLRMERVGRDDNFFELGGHSLLLTRLQNKLGSRFELDIALKQLFEAQTIREQAALIESLQCQSAAISVPLPQPRNADADTVLSFSQQRLWFIDQMGNAGAVYNIPCTLRLNGPLQVEALRKSLESVVRRHEVLRTSLVEVEGEARPHLHETFELALPVHDFSTLNEATRTATIRRQLDAEADKPFDLAADLLLRAQLLQLSDDEHILLLTLHHIASDGWSMGVVLKELAAQYQAEITGQPPALPALPLQYADYAHWQQQWLQGERLEQQLHYWQNQLAALPALHNLPLDFCRPDMQCHHGALHRQYLPNALVVDLKRLARTHDATLFMILEAMFAVLLARWSGDTDIVVGTPIANRRHETLTPLVGLFVNTLVLRNDLSENPRFTDLLTATRVLALDAFQHQDLPFEMLVDHLRPQRSLSHTPLFQVMFSMDTNDDAVISFGGLEASEVESDIRHAKFDLTLNVQETHAGLEAHWDYDRDLFRTETVSRMAASFEALLRGVVAAPEQCVQAIPMLASTERLPDEAIGPCRTLSPVAGVHVLFEARADAVPDAIAIRDGEHDVSYRELNQRANRMAHALQALGVGPDQRVAIHVERSVDNFVGALAVLKAGGAYVPLDPAHPPERLARMLADSGSLVLLTQTRLRDALADIDVPRLLLDDDASFQSCACVNPVVPELRQQHMAYVIYTSGSTGAPKGVMVEHTALLNMVEDSVHYFGDDEPIKAAWWTSFGFDVSVFEMFFPLSVGATLHIVPEDLRTDVAAYVQWLTDQHITQAAFPPFIVHGLRECSDARISALSLRRLMVGIEPLQENELYRLRRLLPELVVVNSYGPTETTVYSTYYTNIRDLKRNTPIGRPPANTRIHLLDGAMQPVPSGAVGELYIAGSGVARGYLDQPELTADRFLRNASGERMYRTGDLARWLPEGELEFRGRSDAQVKLNGVRIEPGEIEALLCDYPNVREAVVRVRTDHGPDKKQLVAYLTSRDGSHLAPDGVREYLTQRLPPYMLPAAYVTIDELPVTINGKLDARMLPVPELDAYTATAYVPPANALEQQLAAIWKELLQHDQISVTANFFDLGGHSLNAVRLMSSVREVTGKALPISILFKAPTIRALAAEVETCGSSADESFVSLRGESSQPGLFVFHAAGGDVLCYQPLLRYLPEGMPIHGFRRRELPNQLVPMLCSIEQLADEYVPRMLEQQPEGSFYLAGWSSGGLMALEIASRLEKQGRTVASVMLVDTMLPTGDDLPARFREVGLAELAKLRSQAACNLIREFEPTLPEVTPRDGALDVPATDYFNYLVAANQIGIDFYEPDFRLASPVHYFGCALNRDFLTVEQRIAGIQTRVAEPISHDSFEATHFSVMEEPCAGDLGRAMASVIEHQRSREALPTSSATQSTENLQRETIT